MGIRHVLEVPFEAWLRAEACPATASVRRPDSLTPGSAAATVLFDMAGRGSDRKMTSSRPNQFYGNGFRRLGVDAYIVDAYIIGNFDEHVEPDPVHEQIAGSDLAGGLVEAEPDLLNDVPFGAAAVACIDARFAARLMDAWDSYRSGR